MSEERALIEALVVRFILLDFTYPYAEGDAYKDGKRNSDEFKKDYRELSVEDKKIFYELLSKKLGDGFENLREYLPRYQIETFPTDILEVKKVKVKTQVFNLKMIRFKTSIVCLSEKRYELFTPFTSDNGIFIITELVIGHKKTLNKYTLHKVYGDKSNPKINIGDTISLIKDEDKIKSILGDYREIITSKHFIV